MDVDLHRERLSELKVTNQMGLETVKEFWCNPDIRLGFRAWWVNISSQEERVEMIGSAHAAAHMLKELELEDEAEDFLEFNELAAFRIQRMVTRELQDEAQLATVGLNEESLLLTVLDMLVHGRENDQLSTLDANLEADVSNELALDLALFASLTADLRNSRVVLGAIFDRLELRYAACSLAVVPFLVRRRIECLALLAGPEHRGGTEDLRVLIELILESLPHTRTFSLTRFFACLINEFIQVIMIDPHSDIDEVDDFSDLSLPDSLPAEPRQPLPAWSAPSSPADASANPTSAQPEKRCDYCGNARTSIKKCSRCHARQYCDRTCQLSHWRLVHKDECKSLADSTALRGPDTTCIQ